MEFWNILAAILCHTALFGYLNKRFLKLSASIGIMFLALMASLILVVLQQIKISIINDDIALNFASSNQAKRYDISSRLKKELSLWDFD